MQSPSHIFALYVNRLHAIYKENTVSDIYRLVPLHLLPTLFKNVFVNDDHSILLTITIKVTEKMGCCSSANQQKFFVIVYVAITACGLIGAGLETPIVLLDISR